MEFILGVLFSLIGFFVIVKFFLSKKTPEITVNPAPVQVNFKPLQDAIDALPNKVLQSITSSSNSYKGALGELIGYVKLHSEYDRIIPLGNIVDFLGIRFTKDGVPGEIVFIDVKTGNARLSGDQKELQKLVEERLVRFSKLKIESI